MLFCDCCNLPGLHEQEDMCCSCNGAHCGCNPATTTDPLTWLLTTLERVVKANPGKHMEVYWHPDHGAHVATQVDD